MNCGGGGGGEVGRNRNRNRNRSRRMWERMKEGIEKWVRDYDSLHHAALSLLYLQIAFALIGSLGASYSGVLVIDLAIALFALVAIESSSQSLARTYALLLFSSLLLDLSWFILFSRDIWNISSSDTYGVFYVFSVRLTLAMQILGFSIRLSSSFLWIQIYRLGASYVASNPPHPLPHPPPRGDADFDVTTSFLSPPTPAPLPRQPSDSDLVLGGSIYHPSYFSSLFEDSHSTTPFNAVTILLSSLSLSLSLYLFTYDDCFSTYFSCFLLRVLNAPVLATLLV